LTLRQDLSELFKELSAEAIGQFLHSVNDLPGLVRILDPIQNLYNFDFSFYYNTYGCGDERVFNYTRIDSILMDVRLSKADRAILLNGECMSNWPGIFTISPYPLNRILDACPEANPLRYLGHRTHFDWHKLFAGNWGVLLDSAQKHPESSIHVRKAIGLMFKNRIISPDALKRIHYRLIDHVAVKSCLVDNSNSETGLNQCKTMIFEKVSMYHAFSTVDLFYWALNLATFRLHTYLHYSRGKIIFPLFNVQFNGLIAACPDEEIEMKLFLKRFKSIFDCKTNLMLYPPNSKNISKVFKSFTSKISQHSGIDHVFLMTELYTWFKSYFTSTESLSVVLNGMKDHTFSDPDAILTFFSNFRSSFHISFKRFITNNYDANKPLSLELFKALRRISWSNRLNKLSVVLKDFLSLDARLRFLKKFSFTHEDASDSGNICIFIQTDTVPFLRSFLNGFYNHLIKENFIIFPLKVKLESHGLLGLHLKTENVPLKTFLQEIWKCLFMPEHNFMFEDSENEDSDFFPTSFTPNPWTHPKVLYIMGQVMTLALLNGIKLRGVCLNKIIFDELFEKINLKSHVEEKRDSFITFPRLEKFSKSILDKMACSEYEAKLDSFELLLDASKDFTPSFKRRIFDHQSKFKFILGRFQDGDVGIWSSERFKDYESHFLDSEDEEEEEMETEDVGSVIESEPAEQEEFNYGMEDDIDTYNDDTDRSVIHECVYNENVPYEDQDSVSSNDPSSDKDKESDSDEFISARLNMAHLQLYSLYCGLHPIIRFLTANEAYTLLFKEEKDDDDDDDDDDFNDDMPEMDENLFYFEVDADDL